MSACHDAGLNEEVGVSVHERAGDIQHDVRAETHVVHLGGVVKRDLQNRRVKRGLVTKHLGLGTLELTEAPAGDGERSFGEREASDSVRERELAGVAAGAINDQAELAQAARTPVRKRSARGVGGSGEALGKTGGVLRGLHRALEAMLRAGRCVRYDMHEAVQATRRPRRSDDSCACVCL